MELLEMIGALIVMLIIVGLILAAGYIIVRTIEAICTIPDIYKELVEIRRHLVPEEDE